MCGRVAVEVCVVFCGCCCWLVVREHGGETLEGVASGDCVGREESWKGWGLESCDDFVGGGEEDVVGGCDGLADLGWHPGEGVNNTFGAGLGGPDPVAAVMLWGWS